MERIEPARISEILAESPIWTRLALTAADTRLREKAADTMADYLVHKLSEPQPPVRDPAQLTLAIL